jgi:hypothetical protein
MSIKALISAIVFITIFTTNISASANILDDIKSNFGQEKTKVKDNIDQVKTKLQTEKEEIQTETKKICEIKKGYATKHFGNRQQDRTKEIEEKISNMAKIKTLLSNNKQDIAGLNLTSESLTKLLKQKVELLTSRVQGANTIDCQNQSQNPRSRLQETNQNLAKLDKEIRTQTREFGVEVQRLIIKMKQPKAE